MTSLKKTAKAVRGAAAAVAAREVVPGAADAAVEAAPARASDSPLGASADVCGRPDP